MINANLNISWGESCPSPQRVTSQTITRRGFLETSVAESTLAGLYLTMRSFAGEARPLPLEVTRVEGESEAAAPGAALLELRFGSIRPQGWLLQKTGRYEAPMVAILVVIMVGALSDLPLVREKHALYAKRAVGTATDQHASKTHL